MLHSSWMLPISLGNMGQIDRKISSFPHWHLHADRRSDGQVLVDQALVFRNLLYDECNDLLVILPIFKEHVQFSSNFPV